MFNTTILDVAMGMVFIYLLLSLLCSAANEMIEHILKNRARDLERGIRELLEPRTGSGTPDSGTANSGAVNSGAANSATPDAGTPVLATPSLVERLYSHPLVSSLYEGTYAESHGAGLLHYFKDMKLPSYIPARNFALALMDLVAPSMVPADQSGAAGATSTPSTSPGAIAADVTRLRAAVQGIRNPQVETALTTLIDAAGNDAVRVRMNIEDWFNSSMDRVSGWYKRRSHTFLLILGLLIAILVNADSVLIVRKLASDRPLRESLVAASIAYAQQNATPSASRISSTGSSLSDCCGPNATPTPTPSASPAAPCVSAECRGHEDTPQCKLQTTRCQIEALGLPIGWDSETDPLLQWNWNPKQWSQIFKDHILGWLLTALAISLGAPFWFDLLNKFIVIRSTVKPKEKSPEEKSKD
jgi:hypothetical protein